MLINIKTHHFHSSINHQEHLFYKTLITCYFRPLRTAFLYNTSRSSCLQMFFKISALKSFANFTGKHLCWSLCWRLKACNFIKKRILHRCFLMKFVKCLRIISFIKLLSWLLLHLWWLCLHFFKKVIKQLFCNPVMTLYFFLLDTLLDV